MKVAKGSLGVDGVEVECVPCEPSRDVVGDKDSLDVGATPSIVVMTSSALVFVMSLIEIAAVV